MEITLEEQYQAREAQYQARISFLEQEVSDLRSKNISLANAVHTAFRKTPEYTKMKEQIERLENLAQLGEHKLELRLKANARNDLKVDTLIEDNEALCEEHDVKYWEGITKYHSWNAVKLQRMETEVEELKATIKARDITIQYLKDMLNGVDPKKPKETVMGRRPIDSATKHRVLSLRFKGYTLKQICEKEGISIGAASNLCKGVKKTEIQNK